MNPPPPFTGRRTPSTPRAPRESPPQWETRPASSPLLRPFPFTTPLHPLLYEKKERSGRRKGVADGRLFSGLMVALSCSDHSCAVGPRPRCSSRRSRGRSARPGVRGAAAPGAAVREIAG